MLNYVQVYAFKYILLTVKFFTTHKSAFSIQSTFDISFLPLVSSSDFASKIVFFCYALCHPPLVNKYREIG